jgi:hypothetical protein
MLMDQERSIHQTLKFQKFMFQVLICQQLAAGLLDSIRRVPGVRVMRLSHESGNRADSLHWTGTLDMEMLTLCGAKFAECTESFDDEKYPTDGVGGDWERSRKPHVPGLTTHTEGRTHCDHASSEMEQ